MGQRVIPGPISSHVDTKSPCGWISMLSRAVGTTNCQKRGKTEAGNLINATTTVKIYRKLQQKLL